LDRLSSGKPVGRFGKKACLGLRNLKVRMKDVGVTLDPEQVFHKNQDKTAGLHRRVEARQSCRSIGDEILEQQISMNSL
jgi:hypothetical protein